MRFYGQTPVDFWQRAYVMGPGFDYPALRTGNRELGPLLNFTGGASLRTGLGASDDPHAWVLGVDFNVTSTQYLDDIYLTQRFSAWAPSRWRPHYEAPRTARSSFAGVVARAARAIRSATTRSPRSAGRRPASRAGPLHRPGQPCVLCHDGSIGNPPGSPSPAPCTSTPTISQPAVGASVALTDSQGHVFDTTTNAGRQLLRADRTSSQPVYPMKVAVAYGGVTVNMTADVGRNGSCAACHFDPPGPASPGHVYIPPDGVTP